MVYSSRDGLQELSLILVSSRCVDLRSQNSSAIVVGQRITEIQSLHKKSYQVREGCISSSSFPVSGWLMSMLNGSDGTQNSTQLENTDEECLRTDQFRASSRDPSQPFLKMPCIELENLCMPSRFQLWSYAFPSNHSIITRSTTHHFKKIVSAS